MSDLLPEGEELRRAARWVADRLQHVSDQPRRKILEQATFKFNLSPRETELLLDFFRPRPDDQGD